MSDINQLVKLPPEELLALVGSYPAGSQAAHDLVKSRVDARRRDGASVWRDIEAETHWSTR